MLTWFHDQFVCYGAQSPVATHSVCIIIGCIPPAAETGELGLCPAVLAEGGGILCPCSLWGISVLAGGGGLCPGGSLSRGYMS